MGKDKVTDAFLDKVDEVRGDTSMQSGKSFETLGEHYHDIATVTDPLVESANKLKELGVIGKDRKNAVKFLEGIAEDVSELANGGKISLDKGKQTLSVLDAEIKKLTKREADTQTIKAMTEARKNLDEVLKQISPDYKAQMGKLAEDTKAAAGIASKFRTEGGAEKMLQRVSRGKDKYSKDALQAFDARFGTEFTKDLEDAAIKNQFTRETTNGSRRTLLGTVVGGAIGSLGGGPVGAGIGGAAGAAAGAAIDKVGGRVWQAVLDGTIKTGPWIKVLEDAAKRGPAAVGVTHMVLMKNSPEYRQAVEAGNQ
jgi:hypothetical protein